MLITKGKWPSRDSHFSLVISDPLVCNLLRHSLDVLGRILRICAAVNVEEVVAALGNEKALLVAGGITDSANGNLLNEGRSLCIIFLLANNLSHCEKLLSLNF